MKSVVTICVLLLVQFAKADVSACRTDGCDMRRNDQVEAMLKFLSTSPQLEGRCYGLNSSMLSVVRADDDSFRVKCGESLKDSKTMKIVFDAQSDGSVVAKIK